MANVFYDPTSDSTLDVLFKLAPCMLSEYLLNRYTHVALFGNFDHWLDVMGKGWTRGEKRSVAAANVRGAVEMTQFFGPTVKSLTLEFGNWGSSGTFTCTDLENCRVTLRGLVLSVSDFWSEHIGNINSFLEKFGPTLKLLYFNYTGEPWSEVATQEGVASQALSTLTRRERLSSRTRRNNTMLRRRLTALVATTRQNKEMMSLLNQGISQCVKLEKISLEIPSTLLKISNFSV